MGFIVRTYLDGIEVDTQKVDTSAQLKDNAFVVFNKTKRLKEDACDPFKGGRDKKSVTGAEHEAARNAFEPYDFNVLALPSLDKEIQNVYIEYTKRSRDEDGIKFQLVLPQIEREKPINHEGVIEYLNDVADEGYDKTALCYWVAGAEAGCLVQASCTNKEYDGAFNIVSDLTRDQVRKAIKNGYLAFHKDGKITVVLRDINTLTKINREDEEKKNLEFRNNQTIRVIDQVALASANVFNHQFLGKVPNDEVGRTLLKNELIKVRQELQDLRAIDTYDPSNLVLEMGSRYNEVIGTDAIRPLNCMEILYLTLSVLGVGE